MHKTLLATVSAVALVLSAGAANAQDLSGQTLTVFGPWLTADQESFQKVIDGFTAKTGATVDYAGSDSFEQQIVIDVQAGSPPNVAVFPQPGLAADLAARGGLTALGDDLKQQVLDNYAAGQSWVDLSSYPDESGNTQMFSFPYKADLKSLVWYSPDNFEDAGYDVPESMEALLALSEQMVADGNTPWCIGLGSGGATGWPATDWVEDIMLRTQTPEVYDQWTTNEIPFNDARVVAAIEMFGTFARNNDWVDGGSAAVATTDFRDSPKGMFAVPAKCFMHRQASFIPAFFPEGTELGVDADFFYFPSFDGKDLGRPVLGGGTSFAITKDSPAAQAFIQYLATTEAHEIWMGLTGFLTPHTGVDVAKYANDTQRKLGDILANATTFRFDGSDLMPGAVGAGSFWTGMVDFAGGKSAQEVADEIQTSWDSIK